MFDYNEDKRNYLVPKVISMAAVIPSTTATIHTPVKNLHDTKDLQGKKNLSASWPLSLYVWGLPSEMAKRHFFIWEVTGLV